MWIIGISLGYFYSALPLKLKSKSWLAPVTLILVLGFFPVLFTYFSFTSEIKFTFLLVLPGLALSLYGVNIPGEIRDFFGDKAMGIETMTVHLGLVKASLLSIILLSIGGILSGIAFFITFAQGTNPLLSLLIIALPIAITDLIVLQKLRKLYMLSNEYENSTGFNSIEQEIIDFSTNSPRWIMLVSQTYSIISIIMLVSKVIH